MVVSTAKSCSIGIGWHKYVFPRRSRGDDTPNVREHFAWSDAFDAIL